MRSHVIITGGAGFIGSALVRGFLTDTQAAVLNIDSLTYAGNTSSLDEVLPDERYSFAQVDVTSRPAIDQVFQSFRPDTVFHLAAETHVDRSIDDPGRFIETNIVGTYTMLEAARAYWAGLSAAEREAFRFVHVSTDEVFGSLGATGLFSESTPYSPRSPYAASKAAADHLARAWQHTYGLPVIVTNCSNNFGPYQFPEKLIPLTILRALSNAPIPVYGQGANVRDWLFVADHVRALQLVAERGLVGTTYNIGGNNEHTNLDVVRRICSLMDELMALPDGTSHSSLITFVPDRAGHDFRYALDASRIRDELHWRPHVSFDDALRRTVRWYLDNRSWWEPIIQTRYGMERLGLIETRA